MPSHRSARSCLAPPLTKGSNFHWRRLIPPTHPPNTQEKALHLFSTDLRMASPLYVEQVAAVEEADPQSVVICMGCEVRQPLPRRHRANCQHPAQPHTTVLHLQFRVGQVRRVESAQPIVSPDARLWVAVNAHLWLPASFIQMPASIRQSTQW